MPVHTVLGPIDAAALGPTSMHEHVFSDLRIWSRPSGVEPPPGPIGPRLQGHLRWDALSMPENLVLDDPEVAVAELTAVHAAGGRAIVDLTVVGMGRRVADLREVSRRSGVTICVGCGFYVQDTHPPSVAGMDVDALAASMLVELRDGLDDTGVRPALIGEIGTNHPPTPAEGRVVRAAGRAGAESGAAVNVHLSFRGADGIDVLDALVAEGMDPARVILSHMDERLDRGYHRALAEAGAVLEYDTFGSDFFYGTPAVRNPSDAERLDMAAWLLSEGFGDQLVIGCDVWSQANLINNGGMGYEHLFRRIGPALRQVAGADDGVLRQIFVATPRRLLDRP